MLEAHKIYIKKKIHRQKIIFESLLTRKKQMKTELRTKKKGKTVCHSYIERLLCRVKNDPKMKIFIYIWIRVLFGKMFFFFFSFLPKTERWFYGVYVCLLEWLCYIYIKNIVCYMFRNDKFFYGTQKPNEHFSKIIWFHFRWFFFLLYFLFFLFLERKVLWRIP